jgi:hypothetical protein
VADGVGHRGKAGETGKRDRSGVDHGGPGGQGIDLDQIQVGNGIDETSSGYRDWGDVTLEGFERDQLHRPLRVESVSSREFRQVDFEAVVTDNGLEHRE